MPWWCLLGADGGILLLPLYKKEHKARFHELIAPFWQFTSSFNFDTAEDSYSDWFRSYKGDLSHYVIGYYGADRCENQDFTDLSLIVNEVSDLRETFEFYNLQYITEPWKTYQYPELRRLWDQHFGVDQPCSSEGYISHWDYRPSYGSPLNHLLDSFHSEVMESLGPLASETLAGWSKKLRQIVDFENLWSIETWT